MLVKQMLLFLYFIMQIFIPLNHNDAHWFACVIDICEEQVLILDPMVSPRNKLEREAMVRKMVSGSEFVYVFTSYVFC